MFLINKQEVKCLFLWREGGGMEKGIIPNA